MDQPETMFLRGWTLELPELMFLAEVWPGPTKTMLALIENSNILVLLPA